VGVSLPGEVSSRGDALLWGPLKGKVAACSLRLRSGEGLLG